VLVLAALLLVWGWFLPWVWDNPNPTREGADEFDDQVGFATPLAAGLLAATLALSSLARRRPRDPLAWLGLAALSGCALGAVVALVDNQGTGADYGSGIDLTVIGSALAIGVAAARALSSPSRTPETRMTAGDAIAAAGGLMVVAGVIATGAVLTRVAAVPTAVAGLMALAAPTIAAGARRAQRPGALVAATAGGFALGGAGMAEAPGQAVILIGGLAAVAGGMVAFRARSQP
jgi:hypothetical protein